MAYRVRQNSKKLCEKETVVISARCREHFLPLHTPELRLLSNGGIEFAGASVLEPPYEIRRLSPRVHTMLWTTQGSGRVTAGNWHGRLSPGTLWTAPAEQAHEYWIESSPWHICWICVSTNNAWHFAAREHRIAHSYSADEMQRVLRRITAEAHNKRADGPAVMETYARLIQLLLRREIVASHLPPVDSQYYAISQVFQKVREHPSENWRLESLCRASGLPVGPERFRQLCDKHLGKSPMRLVTEIRMDIARELLSATDYCIYTIANLIGYGDEYAFTAAFHREAGLAPSHYRSRCRLRAG